MSILKQKDFDARLEAARRIAKKNGLDAILVFSTESEPAQVRYFSDYWPIFETAAVLIPVNGAPALIIGPESFTFATARSKIPDIIQIMDFRKSSQPDYPDLKLPKWNDVVRRYNLRNVGLSGYYLMSFVMMMNLARALGGARNVIPVDSIVRPLYMEKSAAEVRCIKAAAKASEAGFKAILAAIRPGMTESELCGIAAKAMVSAGAETTGCPIWCCSGPNSNQAISRSTLRKVKRGEIVHFSIGANVEGYSASIGRPVVLGKCPEATRKFMQVGLDAANMTFDEMRAGRKSGDVAAKIHDFIRSKGYGDAILYGPAHGCGQMECEYPFLETSSTYMLEAGMTFMQDMFLHRGNHGFRWKDGLLVKAKGPAEMLSSYGRKINILDR